MRLRFLSYSSLQTGSRDMLARGGTCRVRFDQRHQDVRVEGLHEVMIDPRFHGQPDILRASVTGDCYDQHVGQARQFPQAAGDFIPIHAGQANIEGHHVGRKDFCLFESRWPVISGVHLITLELEEHRKGVCDIPVIIHDKNARGALLLQFVSRAKRWDVARDSQITLSWICAPDSTSLNG